MRSQQSVRRCKVLKLSNSAGFVPKNWPAAIAAGLFGVATVIQWFRTPNYLPHHSDHWLMSKTTRSSLQKGTQVYGSPSRVLTLDRTGADDRLQLTLTIGMSFMTLGYAMRIVYAGSPLSLGLYIIPTLVRRRSTQAQPREPD